MSAADVHVHSKYSDRPSEWILRRLGAPESFVEPAEVYARAKARGMDFVTISDHNRIEGALDIAHLPGTFLSSEITTYFPDDGCKLHCLVLGVSEEQFATIQELRENVYEFRDYLLEQRIVYSLAHPLFRVNDKLTPDHLEKILLLFNRFEAMNGTRDPRACEMWNVILRHLTPEFIEDLAHRHGIAPVGPEPWVKQFTAGSDDHSGMYIAAAYTETPPAATVGEFLEHLTAGRSRPVGTHGNSLRLAHCFYHIAYGYYKARFWQGPRDNGSLVGELLRSLVERPAVKNSFGDKVAGLAGWLVGAAPAGPADPVERQLAEEFSDLFGPKPPGDRPPAPRAPDAGDDARTFQAACGITQQLSYAFFENLVAHVERGELLESLQNLASLGPVALAIAPYLAAFSTQHKDEAFLQRVARHFPAVGDREFKSGRKAWLTDTFTDVNGVTRMIQTVAQTAREFDRPLTVVTCLEQAPSVDLPVMNFTPAAAFPLPEYESQRLTLPPFLEVIEYLEREQFSELIISTPGPLGLVGLAAARLLGLRVSGIYHTDFPEYVRRFTDDPGIESLCWRYMQWFYGQLDCVFVPTNCYQQQLVGRGFDERKLRVLRRGVHVGQFHPDRRRREHWLPWGLGEKFTFLYVGRVSLEKNVEHLLESFVRLAERGRQAQLVVVGDGPLGDSLRRRFYRPDVAFTGVLTGDDLAAAYASADCLVFPSVTDTFGNVVLEAQASGLPVIVADRGGPQEIVGQGESGLVVDMSQVDSLVTAMDRLWSDGSLRQTLRERGLANARQNRWEAVLDELWHGAARVADILDRDSPTARQRRPSLLATALVGAGLG